MTTQQIDFSTQETGPEDNADSHQKPGATSNEALLTNNLQHRESYDSTYGVPEAILNLNQPEDYKLPLKIATKAQPKEGRQNSEENKNGQPQTVVQGIISDHSEKSGPVHTFIKLNSKGERDLEASKPWDEDINWIFGTIKEHFIGQFLGDAYKVTRGYLDGTGVQLRIYYTKLEPLEKIIASLCIVHGLGEHCGRYMEVRTRHPGSDYNYNIDG